MKDISTLFKMLNHLRVILNRKQRLQMLEMFIVIFIGSLLELLGVTAILPFIQAILTPEDLMSKSYVRFFANLFHINSGDAILAMVGIGIILIYLIKNVYLSISLYLQNKYSNNTQRELSVLMLRSFMNRPYSFFVDNGYGVIMRGVYQDVAGVFAVISNLFKLLSEGLVVIAIAVYLFIMDPVLTSGVLAVGFACMIVLVFGIKRILTRLSYQYRESLNDLGRAFNQASNGIKDIMVFNRRESFVEEYDRAYNGASITRTKSDFAGLMPEKVIETFAVAGIILMLIIRKQMGVDVNSFVPRMAVFAMGAFRLLPSISRLTGYISAFIFNREMVESVYENITLARAECEIKETISTAIDESSFEFNKSIEIKNLNWKYPEGERNIFDNACMKINKGEAIGIIGESGSGKSTLADILLRLYKPQKGSIELDGKDIYSFSDDLWSRLVAYVPQMVFLIDASIKENILFGLKDDYDDKVWEVLEKVSLADFVRSLPGGLNTIVGEKGVKLSGGQRQRISIARALYNAPQILILDEATAALDNETEEAVMDAIDNLAGSITLIIIAHRITTLKNCNKIFEIKEGSILEHSVSEIL